MVAPQQQCCLKLRSAQPVAQPSNRRLPEVGLALRADHQLAPRRGAATSAQVSNLSVSPKIVAGRDDLSWSADALIRANRCSCLNARMKASALRWFVTGFSSKAGWKPALQPDGQIVAAGDDFG